MYLIAHQSSVNRWVSGVFQARDRAIAYFDLVPSEYVPKLLEFPVNTYPVYLLEAIGVEFTLLDDLGVIQYVDSLEINSSDDWCYGNLYYLDRDWQSPQIGKDYMGSIKHIHLDNHHIEQIKAHGVNSLFTSNH